MVSSAHPLASEAGIKIMAQGGNALDAALAAQLVLSLVEPQSSGIGGGAFMLLYDKASGKVINWDGREAAPAGAQGSVFMESNNAARMNFFKAVLGGQSVGVPSLLKMMEAAHRRHGHLAWEKLFAPAVRLAREGFPISPRLAWWLKRDSFLKQSGADVAKIFFDGTTRAPRKEGEIIKNPAFADTLERVAKGGAKAFYQGAIAKDIIAAVGGKNNFSQKDLDAYEAKQRAPLCGDYKGYKICSAAPPSSGGVALLQILGVLEHFNLAGLASDDPEAIHFISEASRLAYADRGVYLADPDFFSVPIKKLVSKKYLKRRAKLIYISRKIKSPKAGRLMRRPPPSQDERALPSTTHLSVVDKNGNAVSLTSSIEGPFGSHIFVRGFFLNNELTDFSFIPNRHGRNIANRVEGGKRPLSSMTPTLVFAPDGTLFATLGSPGGRRIIAYVAQTIIALIDWNKSMQEAIDLPRHTALGSAHHISDRIELELPLAGAGLKQALEQKGHQVVVQPLTSGLHGIRIVRGKLDGGADARRDGVALGMR